MSGYEPDPCPFCGALKVVRMGTTLKCDCGAYRQWERAGELAALLKVEKATRAVIDDHSEVRRLKAPIAALDALRAGKAKP